jgi:LDH2 family malate/lactate/ureidoglycolate dehydrogenase
MVEVLCAVLSGGAMMTEVGGLRVKNRPMRVSHFFLAIDAARFLPMDEFIARMKQMRDTVKNSRPAEGFDEVLIAGDPEWRTNDTRRRDGIPIAQGIWQELSKLAASLNVAAPIR